MTASMKAVLRQYMKSGVLFHAGLSSLLNGFDRNGMMITEQAVNNKVLKRTRRKYRRFIEEHRLSDAEIRAFRDAARTPENDRVYVYWAQGIENAPELVKACVQSLKDWLPEREIILLTADNLADFVQLPEAVMEQYRSGRIGATQLSDCIRTSILSERGGTWIDATVFLSGKVPERFLEDDLFFFSVQRPGLDVLYPSSWWISAKAGHPVIRMTRDLLLDYFSRYGLRFYYMIHVFFVLSLEAYPEFSEDLVLQDNGASHLLQKRMFSGYSEKDWQRIRDSAREVHKLTYKFDEEQKKKPGTWYRKLFGDKTVEG